MSTITIWLLVAVSSGFYNQGNVTVIERFAALNDCKVVAQSIRNLSPRAELLCTQAVVVKP